MVFVITAPPANGDAKSRYIATAVNVLDGHGFSVDQQSPYTTGEATVPVYPLFIASTYKLFGRREMAVKVLQVLIDLATCLLVGFTAFNLAPASLKESAAMCSVVIAGVFSWFTFVWTSDLLTETLTLFLTMSVVGLCILAMRERQKRNWLWLGAGLVCGLALLTRPDSVFLAGSVLLLLLGRTAQERSWGRIKNILSLVLGIALVLTPWVVRNYFTLGKFQPLASEYGFPRASYMPPGYLKWLRTWITDETYFSNVYPPAFHIGTAYFDPNQLPDSAFDSPEEYRRVLTLIAQYNQSQLFTPAISDGFAQIANERITRAPVRFFITLPVRRTASMWLTGFAVRQPTNHGGIFRILPVVSPTVLLLIRILSVLPIIIGGILGFALLCQRSALVTLLLLTVLLRTTFMAYHYAPETRYIVEAYPPMIAACGVATAALWQRLSAAMWRRRHLEGTSE
jgi:4-amino-4-deoxy-L-arabinose transferase-like glycosyltransferase